MLVLNNVQIFYCPLCDRASFTGAQDADDSVVPLPVPRNKLGLKDRQHMMAGLSSRMLGGKPIRQPGQVARASPDCVLDSYGSSRASGSSVVWDSHQIIKMSWKSTEGLGSLRGVFGNQHA